MTTVVGRKAAVIGAMVAAVVLCSLAPSPAAAKPPPGPGRASGFLTGIATSGEAPGTRIPASYFRAGMDVYLAPGMRHRQTILSRVRYAVAQLQRYSVDVEFRGTVPPYRERSRSGPYGLITVYEVDRQRSCTDPHDAKSIIEAVTHIDPQRIAGVHEVDRASVTFCPAFFSNDSHEQENIALHEFGHAVGLGHLPERFHGTRQVMFHAATPSSPNTYQAGDIDGLRYLVYQQHRLQRLSTVLGSATGWSIKGRHVYVGGWALTGRLDQATNLYLTVDGHVIDSGQTGFVSRPRIARLHHSRFAMDGYHFAAPARSGAHRYCVLVADYMTPKYRQTVDCRTLELAAPAHFGLPASTGLLTSSNAASRAGAVAVVAGLLVLGAVGSTLLVVRRRRRISRATQPG